MPRTIHKYDVAVAVADRTTTNIRRGAKILSVSNQHYLEPSVSSAFQFQVWAEVSTDEPLVPQDFIVRGTGHPLTGEEGRFLGTVILAGGALVFHVYLPT